MALPISNAKLGQAQGSVVSTNAGTTLNYGGSLNRRTGRLGPKPKQGQHFKARKRLETICRLENAGFTRTQMAAMLVISNSRLGYLMRSPEYLAVRTALTHGIILDHDAQLSLIRAQGKEMLKQLLPPAFQLIANEIQRQPVTLAERKHQVALAQDLMDREGTFAKVSRTEVKPVDSFDFESVDGASRSIISAIRGTAAPSSGQHTREALDAHLEFSNCKTLSAVDQQEALKILETAVENGELSEALLDVMPPANASVN